MRTRDRWRIAAALGLGVVGGLRADVHPNTAGGFPVQQAFSSGEVYNVNLFNGSLVLTIPIGMSYPVASGFSYRLSLVYNHNPWEFVTNTVVDEIHDVGKGIVTSVRLRNLKTGQEWLQDVDGFFVAIFEKSHSGEAGLPA